MQQVLFLVYVEKSSNFKFQPSLSLYVWCCLHARKLRFIKGQPVAINFFLLFSLCFFLLPFLTLTFQLHSPNFNTYTINNTPVKIKLFVCWLWNCFLHKNNCAVQAKKMLCLEINFYGEMSGDTLTPTKLPTHTN